MYIVHADIIYFGLHPRQSQWKNWQWILEKYENGNGFVPA